MGVTSTCFCLPAEASFGSNASGVAVGEESTLTSAGDGGVCALAAAFFAGGGVLLATVADLGVYRVFMVTVIRMYIITLRKFNLLYRRGGRGGFDLNFKAS